jgi:hypothetical protein
MYKGKMDEQCIEICDAMNSIDGVETFESCSGHSKHTFRIFFTITNSRGVYAVLRANDPRYGGPNWKCEASTTDIPKTCVCLCLESRCTGKKAYSEAKLISNNIIEILDNKVVCEMFSLKRREK